MPQALSGLTPVTLPTQARTNYIFTTETELQNADISKWSGQYDALINGTGESAAVADASSFQHVTDGPNTPGNTFEVDGDREDYSAATSMSARARDSALAYWFRDHYNEGNADAYARTAVDTIYEWFLDDSDYMEPDADIINVGAGTIRVDVWLPSFVYAAALVADHPRWDNWDSDTPWKGGSVSGNAEDAFAEWLRDYTYTGNYSGGDSHREQLDDGFSEGWLNNRNGWYCQTELAVAIYLGRPSDVENMKGFYKNTKYPTDKGYRHWSTWHSQGYINDQEAVPEIELDRGRDFNYVTFHEQGLIYCTRILKLYDGTDLYGFVAPNDPTGNATLKRGANWQTLQDAVKDQDQWNDPFESASQSSISDSDLLQGTAIYEMAYEHWGDSAYLNVLQNADSQIGSRPFWDPRALGPITLTHGA